MGPTADLDFVENRIQLSLPGIESRYSSSASRSSVTILTELPGSLTNCSSFLNIRSSFYFPSFSNLFICLLFFLLVPQDRCFFFSDNILKSLEIRLHTWKGAWLMRLSVAFGYTSQAPAAHTPCVRNKNDPPTKCYRCMLWKTSINHKER